LLFAVGATALLVRLLYVWQISSVPFLAVRIGDAEAYHEWAVRIAGGDWVGSGVFYQSPLYPHVLALLYTSLTEDPTAIRVVQAVIGAASCVLLAWIGIAMFGRFGALAGLGLALYPAAIFLDGQLDKSVLVTFLLTTLLAAVVVRRLDRFSISRSIAAGVLLALLALTRENALLLALPILAWIVVTAPSHADRRRLAAAFVAGTLTILVPVGLRNLAVGGEFHLTTAQLGPNLYIGNHAGASGTYEPLVAGHGSARDERDDATRLAEAAVGRALGPRAVSRYWTSQAFSYVRSQPAEWLRLLARKAALGLSTDEIADTESQDVYAESSSLLRALSPFSFGVLLMAAAAGVVLTAHRWKRVWLLHVIALTYFAGLIAFYVVARYRFPLVPVLMLCAAGGIAEAVERSRRLPLRTIASALAAATLGGVCAHLARDDVRAARAAHFAGVATVLSRSAAPAQVGQAVDLYERALAELPGAPGAEFGLATVLTRAGRTGEALPHFRAAIAAWPDHAEARYNFGVALAAGGQPDAALEQLDEAVRLRPFDVDARMALGRTLLALERPDAAAAQYERVLEQQPRSVKALAGLGIALTMAGRVGDALAVYDRALAIDPNDADVHNNLGWSLASTGRIRDAIPHFERALALNPAHANARENLARARKHQPEP
jgi:tetratricopeptide (TPR) repeat protein